MNLLAWNCRGLGNPRAIRALKELIRHKDPKVLFLMETKLRADKMLKIKHKLGFVNGVAVDCVGRSGGLALLWTEGVNISLRSFSAGHIDMVIGGQNNDPPWFLTGFYGNPVMEMRRESWKLLERLS